MGSSQAKSCNRRLRHAYAGLDRAYSKPRSTHSGCRTVLLLVLPLLLFLHTTHAPSQEPADPVDTAAPAEQGVDPDNAAEPSREDSGRLVRPPAGWSPANPFLDEEAPPAVFDLDTGDAEVELFLLGSWSARSQLATGLSIAPDSGLRFPVPYPGFETDFFSQTVDLTLSLWLFQRYFFEAAIADESDINTIAAGYFAAGDELVRELVVGNVPLAIQPYPYQYAGSPEARAGATPNPAAVVRLATAATYHELLVRLENSQAREEVFLGGRRLSEDRIPAGSWLRGRAFVLPDRDLQDVQVLIADPDGSILAGSGWDGAQRFRALEEGDGEVVIDRSAGTLRLAGNVAESGRTVAVFYRTAGGTAVGQAGAGTDSMVPLDAEDLSPTSGGRRNFSFGATPLYDLLTGTVAGGQPEEGPPLSAYRLPLADGRSALILSGRGLWSPFELANLYPLPEGLGTSDDGLRFDLVRRGTGELISSAADYQLRRVPGQPLLEVTASRNPLELGYRYPFAERAPRTANAAIYGPGARRGDDPADLDILVRATGEATPATELQLDGQVVPGSLSVSVDGRTLDGFTFDPSSGLLTLPDSVSGLSRVEVRFREFVPGDGGSDLVVVSGNVWDPREDLSLSLAAGLRWTLTDRSFSTTQDEHPGSLTLSAGLSHSGERLDLNAEGAMQLAQTDTTGLFRLAGAGPDTLQVAPDAENLFPAAPGSGGSSRDPADRVLSAFRDAWSVDALGNISLLSYAQSLDREGDATGDRVGPWVARSTDADYSGPVAVTEWDSLPPGAWSGTLLRLPEPGSDLSDITSLSFPYRILPPPDAGTQPSGGSLELLVRIGSTAEDLDGDGELDGGRSRSDPLLEFSSGAGPRAAGQDAPGLAAAHTEDADGNGLLDPAASAGLVERTIALVPGSGAWQRARLDLSSLPAAERQLLASSTGIEVILRNTDGVTATSAGRLLLGTAELARSGAGVRLVADGSGSARATTAEDPLSGSRALRARYDRIGGRLAEDAEEQRVYRLDWSGGDGSEVTMEADTASLRAGSYGSLGLYLYLDDSAEAATGADTLNVVLLPYRGAPAAETLRVTIPATAVTADWHELSIAEDGAPRIDGIAVGTVEQRPPDGSVLRLLQVSVTGMGAGTLAVDELHARDPRVGLAAAAALEMTWNDTVSDGALAGLSYRVTQDLQVQTDAFRGTDATSVGRALAGSTDVDLRRGSVRLGAEAGLRQTGDEVDARFGHRVDLPLAPAGVISLEERFLRDYDRRAPVETRALGLRLTSQPLSARLQTDGRADARETSQEWRFLISPALPADYRLALAGSASVLAPDRAVGDGDYGARWLASTWRLDPRALDEGRRERDQDVELSGTLRAWEYRLQAGVTGAGSLRGLQEHRMEVGSNLPVDIRPDTGRPWRVGLSYDRSWRRSESADAGSFATDRRDWFARLGSEPQILVAPPLAELFMSPQQLRLGDTLSTDDSRSSRARAGLSYRRAVGSRPADLVVPGELELGLERQRSWEADSVEDRQVWEAEFAAVAINLFGSLGSRPLSSRFQSDEYRNALALELVRQPATGSRDWTLELSQETRLFGSREREISVESSMAFTGPDTSTESYRSSLGHSWVTDRAPDWRLLERVDGRVFYRHTQELGLEAERQDARFATSLVELSHETALVVGANGQIAVYGDLGWQTDAGGYDRGLLHLIGMAIGIEGRLQY